MQKKGLIVAVVLLFAIFIFAYTNFAKNEQDAVTQGELAQMLGEKMDLEVHEGTGAAGYIKALEGRGIKPSSGWNAGKPVTNEDFSTILAGVGRLQAEVAAGKDPQSALKEVGVILPKDINRKTVNKVLEEPNVKRLLEAPIVAGASIPYPSQEIGQIGEAQEGSTPTKEALLAPTPPPPEIPSETRPSGGGGN